jgi:hypothetical protein
LTLYCSVPSHGFPVKPLLLDRLGRLNTTLHVITQNLLTDFTSARFSGIFHYQGRGVACWLDSWLVCWLVCWFGVVAGLLACFLRPVGVGGQCQLWMSY